MNLIVGLAMNVLIAILILIAAWVVGNWVKKAICRIEKLDGTLKSFLGGVAKYSILAMALVTVLGQFGVQTASLIAVLGAAGLAIGLALQGTLSNVAAGVMLLILRPFNVGDVIEFGGHIGEVKELGLFGTELSTPDNVYVHAPNSTIWNTEIRNYSRNKQRRQDFSFGISYSDDINKAFKTIDAVLKKEKRLILTKGKEPLIVVGNLGGSSVDIKARVWTKTDDFWDVQFDLMKAVKEALDKDGINIPFPTRTLHMIQSGATETKKTTTAKKKAA